MKRLNIGGALAFTLDLTMLVGWKQSLICCKTLHTAFSENVEREKGSDHKSSFKSK